MKDKIKIVSTVGILIFIFDQWTKSVVMEKLKWGQKVVIFDNFLDIVHARNRGAAFGVLSNWDSPYRDAFFYVLSAAALGFLYSYLHQIPRDRKWWAFPVGLVFGGALGNIYDRIIRGSVVDFISVHWNNQSFGFSLFGYFYELDLTWPAFNIADSAITIGVILLIVFMSFIQDKPKKTV